MSVFPYSHDKYMFFMIPIEKLNDTDLEFQIGQFQNNPELGIMSSRLTSGKDQTIESIRT